MIYLFIDLLTFITVKGPPFIEYGARIYVVHQFFRDIILGYKYHCSGYDAKMMLRYVFTTSHWIY